MRATSEQLREILSTVPSEAPLAVFDCDDEGTLLAWGEGPAVSETQGWPAQARALLTGDALLVGWVAYEAGAAFERMPSPKGPVEGPTVLLWRPAHARWLHSEQPEPSGPPAAPTAPAPPPGASPASYQRGVARLLQYVAEGDVYQPNLAWKAGPLPCPDPLEAWLRLRVANPATRGAFVRARGHTVLSNSPELFLRVRPTDGGSTAETAPIKGTAPGTALGAAHLLDSEKERAELTMIVDMARNDLSRVAAPGSVQAGPRALRRCGDLWHAEQPVRAAAPAAVHSLDWFAAAFPPASVTGAPKVRAMQRIQELEAGPRGVYTGAIGWMRGAHDAHWNVAIRTAQCANGVAYAQLGAGIVADSTPESEWRETLQ